MALVDTLATGSHVPRLSSLTAHDQCRTSLVSTHHGSRLGVVRGWADACGVCDKVMVLCTIKVCIGLNDIL